MIKIASGNGNRIMGIANRIAHNEGYKSMWLYSDKPILKANRWYTLHTYTWLCVKKIGFLTQKMWCRVNRDRVGKGPLN